MIINTNDKTISADKYRLENWGNVRWLIKELERSAELVFGPEKQVEKKSAVILKLVKDE